MARPLRYYKILLRFFTREFLLSVTSLSSLLSVTFYSLHLSLIYKPFLSFFYCLCFLFFSAYFSAYMSQVFPLLFSKHLSASLRLVLFFSLVPIPAIHHNNHMGFRYIVYDNPCTSSDGPPPSHGWTERLIDRF